MIIKCSLEELEALKKAVPDSSAHIKEISRFSHREADLSITEMRADEVDALRAILEKAGSKSNVRKLDQFRKVSANPLTATISRLEALELALLELIGDTPHKWLFSTTSDDALVPYYVESVTYHPPESSYGSGDHSARVTMKLKAALRGEGKDQDEDWRHGDLFGKMNVTQFLAKHGYVVENPVLVATYEKEMEHYNEVKGQLGEQFAGVGQAFTIDRYYPERVYLVREGLPARLVMDDTINENNDGDSSVVRETKPRYAASDCWLKWAKNKQHGKLGKAKANKADLDLGDDETQVEVPVQPYLKMFDLKKHRFITVHTNNISPWDYVQDLLSKLVLAEDRKDLIRILIDTSAELHEDIIQGKTGGTIVTATGAPGTGKTLTAEVFAEEMKRPLYVVQCSQLGTEPDELEKKLEIVLNRATRWKAILLLDEADVYVHERGDDINQNAIVGVFLRVLEYYRGILFMTSNRDVVIDDAILSRATAHIRYILPADEACLGEVWDVLCAQYEVTIDHVLKSGLLGAFPPGSISPRNVKNLLKLARSLINKQGRKVDVELFKYVARFIDLADPSKLAWLKNNC